jgi:hypothetical protein
MIVSFGRSSALALATGLDPTIITPGMVRQRQGDLTTLAGEFRTSAAADRHAIEWWVAAEKTIEATEEALKKPEPDVATALRLLGGLKAAAEPSRERLERSATLKESMANMVLTLREKLRSFVFGKAAD